MRRAGRVIAAAGAAALVMIIPASAAIAANATGCSGSVATQLADGQPLDYASAPGDGGTATDPLVIDRRVRSPGKARRTPSSRMARGRSRWVA